MHQYSDKEYIYFILAFLPVSQSCSFWMNRKHWRMLSIREIIVLRGSTEDVLQIAWWSTNWLDLLCFSDCGFKYFQQCEAFWRENAFNIKLFGCEAQMKFSDNQTHKFPWVRSVFWKCSDCQGKRPQLALTHRRRVAYLLGRHFTNLEKLNHLLNNMSTHIGYVCIWLPYVFLLFARVHRISNIIPIMLLRE